MDEEKNLFESRVDLTKLAESIAQIKKEIGKVIVGQEKSIDLIITALLADGHVLIEGVPGVAKTLISKLVARVIDAKYSRIQFTPDLMPSDILGTSIFNQKDTAFEFNAGPIFSQIVLIDEINRAPAKTQAALFEVMEERQVTIDGTTHMMEEPFLVLATQNPIEQEGTYRLPEAQLDRFIFKISIEYPDLNEEVSILSTHHQRGSAKSLDKIERILKSNDLLDYRNKVKQVHVEEPLMHYIAEIVHATRKHQSIYLGASPRASVNLMNAAKAYAALQGRDFITPEDIVFVSIPVMRHRIIITPEKEMEGGTSEEVLQQIIDKVEIPR